MIPVLMYRNIGVDGKIFPIERDYECSCENTVSHRHKKEKKIIQDGRRKTITVEKEWGEKFGNRQLQFPMPEKIDYMVAYRIGSDASLKKFHETGIAEIKWTDEMQKKLDMFDR